jgi:SAM-dependent methyltransferase
VIDYDRIALEYTRHRKVHPGVLRSLILRSGIDGDSRVLEVGCGTGNYIHALQDAVGCSCWAIDPSEEMLAAARDRSAGVVFQIGRAERLDFEPAFFDLVFSVDVIHHVDDHAAHFGEVHRVLEPGGRVCTATDSEWIIRNREPLAVYFPETVDVDLRRYPRLTVLRALIQGAGLRHIEEELVEFAYEVVDPSPYADQAFSSLHLISEEAFQRGLQCMRRDLRVGPIAGVSRYVLLWGREG